MCPSGGDGNERKMIQGQSLSTIDKERKLAAMFDMQGRLYMANPAVLGVHPAFHIDLNAGCGYNCDYDVPGSPMVFLAVMKQKYPAVPFRAWFIDRDPDAARVLAKAIETTYSHLPNVTVLCEDNRDALARIRIPRLATGSVLADPNGWLCRNRKTGAGAPLEELQAFAESHPRIDLLMNLNARHYKLTSDRIDEFPLVYSVSEFHWLFQKKHWLITHPVHNGHSSFVCVTGRNFETGDYKAFDWHHLNSPTGFKICERLEISARQPQRQRGLFNGHS